MWVAESEEGGLEAEGSVVLIAKLLQIVLAKLAQVYYASHKQVPLFLSPPLPSLTNTNRGVSFGIFHLAAF